MSSSWKTWLDSYNSLLAPWTSLNRASYLEHKHTTSIGLPSELIDHITDNLWDDKMSLAACTLVSRQWMLSATYHLFRRITVTDEAGCVLFHQFAMLLHSDNVRSFGLCVRELHLQSFPPGQVTTKLVDINLQVLAVILQACPRLEHLRLTRIRWMRQPYEGYPVLVMPFVSRLTLSYRVSHVLPDFAGIFQWFPNVTECVLEGGYMPALDSYVQPVRKYADPIPFPQDIRLSVLHLKSHIVPSYILEWAAETDTIHTLRSFHASISRPDELLGLAKVLHNASSTLLDLRLDLTSSDYNMFFLCSGVLPEFSIGQILPITQCTAIQSLHLVTGIIATAQPEWDGAPVTTTPIYLTWFISAIPSTTFRSVTLEFKGSIKHVKYQLVMPEWGAVDEVLVAHPSIDSVEIVWERSWNVNGIREAMCQYFPALYASGKLRFQKYI